ncbi:nucleotidyl transferase AbiEii/AbiGii toxin family protein [Myroides sp. N17-2]|uniref:nucleotidyl transferase AbiEii/AbiGii toxin family protein n=1 Tax=Myroides sp. N17-2 TaxID=2030799 RepID=UPI000EFB789E|nr:nucleotidyl transferase AbiEii/AbiGii toxin family protein [Myroides sp. N17-2]
MVIDKRILSTIIELQELEFLKPFYLAGGTNLALRFNHRRSEDIDLFCEEIIGINGFAHIERELTRVFKDRILFITYPTKQSNELVFIRLVIKTDDLDVKVEILQGFKLLKQVEVINNIRLSSIEDIGTFKLESLANRFALKDLFDLDYITEKIQLSSLLISYKKKKDIYRFNNIKTIFHFDNINCPLENLSILLEVTNKMSNKLPYHSSPNNLDGVSNEHIIYVTSNWRMKVKRLL